MESESVVVESFTTLFVLQEYKKLFDGAGTNPGEKTLEDKFFEYEVRIECGYDSDKSFVQH